MIKIILKDLLYTIVLVILISACEKDNGSTNNTGTDSGVKIGGKTWATTNVGQPGAFVASETDFGLYYQWNNKTQWSGIGTVPGWIYEWQGGYSISGQGSWDEINDPCPIGWRLPTQAEFEALYTACFGGRNGLNAKGQSGWKEIGEYKSNRSAGVLFDDNNGHKLFLPASGYISGFLNAWTLSRQNSSAFYWTSTVFEDRAYDLYFDLANWTFSISTTNIGNRGNGFSIRCVKK